MFVDDETGEVYDYSAWSQVVRVEAYDAAGHRTLRNALLYDTVYGEKMYNEDGFNDARYSDGTIRGDILDLDPLWSNESGGLSDSRFLITDDMLDENGNLHVKATLDRDANVLIFNGSEYWPEEGSRQVEFDIPIHAGLNPDVRQDPQQHVCRERLRHPVQAVSVLPAGYGAHGPCALTTRASPTAR